MSSDSSYIAKFLPPSMLVGVPSIDEEHEALFSELNRLSGSHGRCCAEDVFFETLSELGVALAAHFDNEEAVLRSCGMPAGEVNAHIRAHAEILEQNAELHQARLSGRSLDRAETLHVIRLWIVEHLVTYDLVIRTYAASR